MTAILHSLMGRRFYLMMSLLCAAVVFIGFTPHFGERMVHPATPVPLSLWVHTVVFTAWVFLVIAQSGLVQARQVALHRRLGFASVALAVLMVVAGIWVAIETTRARVAHGAVGRESFLAIPFSNMAAFAAFFGVAVWRRKKPEEHKRLMLLAVMSLTIAALARFPAWLVPPGRFNIALDVFIAIALLRDLIVDRRIHHAYLIGFPALIAFQLFVEWLRFTPWWIDVAGRIVR